MSSTLVNLPVVVLLPRDEINKVYDALDYWRDFIVHRYRLTDDDRSKLICKHGDFARGVKTGLE